MRYVICNGNYKTKKVSIASYSIVQQALDAFLILARPSPPMYSCYVIFCLSSRVFTELKRSRQNGRDQHLHQSK